MTELKECDNCGFTYTGYCPTCMNPPKTQTADQKIAEIRRKHSMHVYDGYEDDVQNAIGLLLSELDRLTLELKVKTEYSEELEKDNYHTEANLSDLSRHHEQALRDREKLIEGMKHYADRRNHPPFWSYDDGEKARTILKSIGVEIHE